jgi:hypothetical protein
MTWFDWLIVGVCWSLPFLCYAVRRWRVRIYLRRFPPAESRLVNEGMPVGAGEAKDSSQRALSCEDFGGTAEPEPPANVV